MLSHENELETQEVTFDTQFEFETGEDIGFEVKNTTEHLAVGFDLQGEEIPADDLQFYIVSDINANEQQSDD